MSSYINNHIIYGNRMLSNKRIQITELEFLNSSPVDIQTMPISRGAGSSVTRTRNESREIKLIGGITPIYKNQTEDEVLSTTDDIKTIFNKQRTILRVVPKSKMTILNDCQSVNGWVASDDAVNLALDTQNFEYEKASIAFDVDVSNSGNNYATITKTLSTPIDLSSVSDTGNFELSLYLGDAYYITSIDIQVGNNNSNYYSASITSNYNREVFSNGVNYLSVDWGNEIEGKTITETGTVNDSAIDYLYIRINYNSSASDFQARLNFFAHVQEDFVRNYPCYSKGGVNFDPIWYKATDAMPQTFEVNLFNYTGYGIATHDIQLFEVTGITSTVSTQTVNLRGNLAPQLNNTFVLNTITNLNDLRYKNVNTQEQIRWTNTWVAGDIVNFDKLSSQVTRNGLPQDYDGALPDNVLGTNRLEMSIVTGAATTLSQLTYNTDISLGTPSVFAYHAQSFLAPASGTITELIVRAQTTSDSIFYIRADGSPAGNLPATGASPAPVWQSGYLTNMGSVSLLTFSPNYAVLSGTRYWIQFLKVTSFSNAYWSIQNSGNPYANGKAMYYDRASSMPVELTNQDFYFSVSVTPTPSTNINWSATYKPLYL